MYTKQFSQLSKKDAAIAGGKGASLGEMTKAGIPVPPGFVVLTNAFEQFLTEATLQDIIAIELGKVRHTDMRAVESVSKKIQALILRATIPKDVTDEIMAAFKQLGAKFVAVRSSATAEDSSSAAWAGQLQSFLYTDKRTLMVNIQKCWASLFSPRAIFYRFEKKLQDRRISVAVVVQKMVNSEVSGVAFSVHPVTKNINHLVIEAGFGLGEAIVSGQITPDTYVVDKKTDAIIDKHLSDQERMLIQSPEGGLRWSAVNDGKKQKLSTANITELTNMITNIEQHYGFPVDVEWALEKDKLYITQSRPITTL